MRAYQARAETEVRPDPTAALLHGHWRVLAWGVWGALVALALSLFAAAIPALYAQRNTPSEAVREGLAQLGLTVGFYAGYVIALQVVLALAYFAVAALIVRRKSDDGGALFVALFLVLVATVNAPNMAALEASQPTLVLLAEVANVLLGTSLILFLFLFPDGRFVPRWTCAAALIWLAGQLLLLFLTGDSIVADPPDWLALLVVAGLVIGIGAQIYRYVRVSVRVQRQQTKWVVFGTAAAIIGQVIGILIAPSPAQTGRQALLADLAGITIVNCSFLLIPLAIGIAILRYRLWDIDIIINHTLVYGALTAIVAGLYVLVVGALGALVQSRGNLLISLIATGLVAALFQPLRDYLQRAVNRLLYGDRDDPYAVLSRLGKRLETALAPDAVLPTIVETVKEALKLPYAAILLRQGEEFRTMAESGRSVGEPVRLPLVYQSETVGRLLLAPRAPGETFSPLEWQLLDDLARQAGIAVHAVRLTADLQHSRERLVTAREEERRRLRRDLHDGLGPQLAALTLKLETARNRLTHDPLADALLADITERTQAAVADIRRLVYALRPPTLDEFGLVAALREGAAQHGLPEENTVSITVDAPEHLPPLPAAVEVAAYRIAQEALTNVVRHAAARSCVLRLTLDEPRGLLWLEIQDDGCGLPTMRRSGVGLQSMRERAEELGGSCEIESVPGAGTRVRARLSYGKYEAQSGQL
jgi:signal transduction histidine kinase